MTTRWSSGLCGAVPRDRSLWRLVSWESQILKRDGRFSEFRVSEMRRRAAGGLGGFGWLVGTGLC